MHIKSLAFLASIYTKYVNTIKRTYTSSSLINSYHIIVLTHVEAHIHISCTDILIIIIMNIILHDIMIIFDTEDGGKYLGLSQLNICKYLCPIFLFKQPSHDFQCVYVFVCLSM